MNHQQQLEQISTGFTRLMHYLHHLAGQVSKIGDFSLAQYRILMLLYHHQPMTVTQLRQMLGNAQSTVSEMLMRMEEQGLVKRGTNPNDRRQTLLSLSNKANQMIEERKEKMVEIYKQLIHGKSHQEIQELIDLLNRLLSILEKEKNNSIKG